MVNIPNILAVAFLGSVAANLIHWRGRKGEQFLYLPQSGFLRSLFLAWTYATIAASVLFLAGTISAVIFIGVGVGLAIAHELYSVVRRHQQRAT